MHMNNSFLDKVCLSCIHKLPLASAAGAMGEFIITGTGIASLICLTKFVMSTDV